MKDVIVDHLTVNSLINKSQHGFSKNKSCVTNLLEFLETITNEIDTGACMDVIYLDFSKAFDKVPKLRLLEKCRAHNIGGKLLSWLEMWLTGRRQRVVLNGEYSDWQPVHSGVPQGSVLGPLAFLIFINDLDLGATLIKIIKKFADDTKLGHTVMNEDDQKVLQDCLNNLFEWAETWGMSFNIDKCKVLHLGRENKRFSYTMNNKKLITPGFERDIGVMITEDLKPSKQCKKAAKAANFVLRQITRAFHFRDRNIFLRLYKQYVRCHLEFSTPAWSPWLEKDKETLEKVQKRAVRQISGLSGKNYEEKLKELGLMSLEQRRHRYDMLQTFKILKGFDDVNKSTWFQTMDNSVRETRLSAYHLNLTTGRSRLDVRKHFFSQRVVDAWNSLPVDLKDSLHPNQFKNKYDRWWKGLQEA